MRKRSVRLLSRNGLLAGLLLMSFFVSINISPVGAQSIDYGTMESIFGEPVTTSANGNPQREADVPLNM